jgi:hypothetical protein
MALFAAASACCLLPDAGAEMCGGHKIWLEYVGISVGKICRHRSSAFGASVAARLP